ncbi:unnamed protein product [Caretta caretta]
MAGEIVYADLNIRGDSSLTSRPQPSHHLKCHHFPRWRQIAQRVSWAANVVLLGAMMVLSVWVFQGACHKAETGAASVAPESDRVTGRNGHGTDCNSSLASHLRQRLCDSPRSSSAEAPGCRLCPLTWLLHGDKCYWFSKDSKNWNESRDDCLVKSSQMLMTQDQREMDFINTIAEGTNHIWIGLNITSHTRNWTWVDGSPLNQTLFPVSGPVASGSCGVVKGNSINSETCSAEFKWICQKDAIVV